jgi:hypothetical protein
LVFIGFVSFGTLIGAFLVVAAYNFMAGGRRTRAVALHLAKNRR